MKKRILSFALCFCLLFSVFPTAAMATDTASADVFTDGTGTYDPATQTYTAPADVVSNAAEAVYLPSTWSENEPHISLFSTETAEAAYQTTENGEWLEGSFADAVTNVYNGGTVKLLTDVYLTATTALSKDMTITSSDPADPKMITCAISGHGYLLNISSGTLTLDNVAVDGGYNESADEKIYSQRALIAVNGGDLELNSGAEIRNNYNATVSGAGGGICVISGTVTMTAGRIYDNYACSSGGVAIVQEATNEFTMTGGSVDNNTAVTMYTTRTYTNGWKVQIRAGGFGGGFGISAGTLNINGGSVKNNTAQPVDLHQMHQEETEGEPEWYSCDGGFGGGIATYSASSITPTVSIADITLEGNNGFYGGAIYTDWGSITIQNSTIKNNQATSKIVREEDAVGGYTEDRWGGHGGGVYISDGDVSISNSEISGNHADYYGGGIFQLQSSINSSNNRLAGSSNLVLSDVNILDNEAYACAGMFVNGSDKSSWDGNGTWGTTTLTNVEVSRNTATSKGGGVLVAPWQDVSVSGSVKIYNNTAPDHTNFLLDNDIEYGYDPGRIVVAGALSDDAVLYVDVCEHTTPYEDVHQLVAVGTDAYSITQADFEKFKSDNALYITEYDSDCNVYLVPGYTVAYDLSGGTGAGGVDYSTVTVSAGSEITVKAAPVRYGYSFIGWSDGTAVYQPGATITVSGNITLTAQWEEIPQYTVTYDLNGGTGTAGEDYSDQSVPVGTEITVKAAPTRDGYTFTGWSDGTATYQPEDTITVTSDITLAAQWEKDGDPPIIIPIGTAKLTKVDADDHSIVIPGVKFELYRSTGRLVGTCTTDRNGEIKVSSLVSGNYYWKEVSAADGYVLNETEYPFTVSAWQTTSIVVENEKETVDEPENPGDVPDVFTSEHYAYIVGYSDGLVHPEANITRAEVATIFFRLLDEETRNLYMTRENDFSDVASDKWYNTAVSTMAAMGIVTGRPGGIFDPNANITRAEFAAIAARFDANGNTTGASFTDIYDHWAQKEINIAANNGWVLGYEDGTFRPDQYITRAEAMTMVNRVLQRIPESANDLHPDMIVWPDNMDTTKWYYLMVQEATNSHDYVRKDNGYESWISLRETPDWTELEK